MPQDNVENQLVETKKSSDLNVLEALITISNDTSLRCRPKIWSGTGHAIAMHTKRGVYAEVTHEKLSGEEYFVMVLELTPRLIQAPWEVVSVADLAKEKIS